MSMSKRSGWRLCGFSVVKEEDGPRTWICNCPLPRLDCCRHLLKVFSCHRERLEEQKRKELNEQGLCIENTILSGVRLTSATSCPTFSAPSPKEITEYRYLVFTLKHYQPKDTVRYYYGR